MSSPNVTYASRPDATPEGELSALSAVYRFILDAHPMKEAAPESRSDDAKGFKNVSRQSKSTA
ncbi:MAG: hypothetical protein H0U04_19920 [Rubrobacter sp.]|jgi:hypothetical protein|nr:hypothetical protein [Rubrobacter sp.]